MLQALVDGLCTSSVYLLLALGFSLVYSTTRVFHIAHGANYTLGAYAGFSVLSGFDGPIWLGALAALFLSALSGAAMEAFVYRPLRWRRASPEASMIASLGLYIVLSNAIALTAGSSTRFLRPNAERMLAAGSVLLTPVQIAQFVVAVVVGAVLAAVLLNSNLGLSWRAIADNPTLAGAIGIDGDRLRLVAVVGGSALAGLAGYLKALDVGTDPNVGFQAVLAAAVACVMGGIGSFLAPMVGALVLGLLQAVGVWYTSASWESAFTFASLLLFLIFRPQGLLGSRRRLEED